MNNRVVQPVLMCPRVTCVAQENELGFFLSQDWPVQERILDLYTEFRNFINSDPKILTMDWEAVGHGLLDALTYFGLEGMSAIAKEDNRKLIVAGGPWNRNEQQRILDY